MICSYVKNCSFVKRKRTNRITKLLYENIHTYIFSLVKIIFYRYFSCLSWTASEKFTLHSYLFLWAKTNRCTGKHFVLYREASFLKVPWDAYNWFYNCNFIENSMGFLTANSRVQFILWKLDLSCGNNFSISFDYFFKVPISKFYITYSYESFNFSIFQISVSYN